MALLYLRTRFDSGKKGLKMLYDFKKFMSKQAQTLEPAELNSIAEEAVKTARGYAKLKPEAFDEKMAEELNGSVCLAWIGDYIAITNGALSGDKEWRILISQNFGVAKAFFEMWQPKRTAELGKIEGLFE